MYKNFKVERGRVFGVKRVSLGRRTTGKPVTGRELLKDDATTHDDAARNERHWGDFVLCARGTMTNSLFLGSLDRTIISISRPRATCFLDDNDNDDAYVF